MFNQNHFDGGANLNAGHGEKHLGRILQAVYNDLIKLGGIRVIEDVSVADAVAVASANASDEATLVTLVNEEKASYNGLAALANNIKLVLSPLAVLEISEPNAVASSVVDATNTATAITLVNDLKVKYNVAAALLNEIKAELNEDGTVDVSSGDAVVEATADASDEATAITLANALKTKMNGAITLANEIKADLNGIEKVALEFVTLFS